MITPLSIAGFLVGGFLFSIYIWNQIPDIVHKIFPRYTLGILFIAPSFILIFRTIGYR